MSYTPNDIYKYIMESGKEADDDIITAVLNGLYVSAFISRYKEEYNVHFLVHAYPETKKAQFEDAILKEVVRYMIMMTIVRLRLDTPQKVKDYLK